MPIPHHFSKVVSALIDEMDKAGGVGETQEIIGKLAQRFQVTQAEREVRDKVKRYQNRSNLYFKNALHFIEAEEAEKASEFLWGCMSQALKALALSRGRNLRSHRQIRNYAAELTKELRDESIWHVFNIAQSLHSNFYESGLLLEDVVMGAEDVKKVVTRLFGFIPDDTEESKQD